MATKKKEKVTEKSGEWFKIPVNPVHPGVYKRRYEGESDTHYAVYADRQWYAPAETIEGAQAAQTRRDVAVEQRCEWQGAA